MISSNNNEHQSDNEHQSGSKNHGIVYLIFENLSNRLNKTYQAMKNTVAKNTVGIKESMNYNNMNNQTTEKSGATDRVTKFRKKEAENVKKQKTNIDSIVETFKTERDSTAKIKEKLKEELTYIKEINENNEEINKTNKAIYEIETKINSIDNAVKDSKVKPTITPEVEKKETYNNESQDEKNIGDYIDKSKDYIKKAEKVVIGFIDDTKGNIEKVKGVGKTAKEAVDEIKNELNSIEDVVEGSKVKPIITNEAEKEETYNNESQDKKTYKSGIRKSFKGAGLYLKRLFGFKDKATSVPEPIKTRIYVSSKSPDISKMSEDEFMNHCKSNNYTSRELISLGANYHRQRIRNRRKKVIADRNEKKARELYHSINKN